MVRIYLDWNVFSYIINKKDQTYIELGDYLIENSDYLLLPYSPAHLQDIKRSYFKSQKGKKMSKRDLLFLNQITGGWYMAYTYNEKSVYPGKCLPLKYFEDEFVDNAFEFSSLESLFADFEDKNLISPYLNLLKTLPLGLDKKTVQQIPIRYQQIIEQSFGSLSSNNTIGSLIDGFLSLLQSPSKFNTSFKQLRQATNKDLKIETDMKKWNNDPFEYINKVLLKDGAFSIDEFQKKVGNEQSYFDTFIRNFIQLDIFGYHKDKRISNLLDDALHAFYGAHSDIFVTDDKNTYNKTKAIYNKFNISTKVLKSEELLSTVSQMIFLGQEKKIGEQITNIVNHSLLLKRAVDNELNPAYVYKVFPLLIKFFNRMQISYYSNYTALIFYKKQSNYSRFSFWKEISYVINTISKEFGADINSRYLFNETDKTEFLNDNWQGRYWEITPKLFLELIDKEHPFGITFEIRLVK